MDEKYSVMHKIAKKMSADFNKKVNEATDGKGYNAFVKESESMYDAAFGIKNNIARRVEKYNIQQQTGAMILKGGVKAISSIGVAALTVATMGTGTAALFVTAGATTAISATVDISDGLTSEDGISSEELKKYLLNAGIDGLTTLAGGTIAKALSTTKGFISVGGRLLGDVAVGVAAEKIQTGEISLNGVVFQCVFSAAGSLVSIKPKGSGKGVNVDTNPNATKVSAKAETNVQAPKSTKAANKPQTTKTNTQVASKSTGKTHSTKATDNTVIGHRTVNVNGEEVTLDIYRSKDGREVVDFSKGRLKNGEEVSLGWSYDIMSSASDVDPGRGGFFGLFNKKKTTPAATTPAKPQSPNEPAIVIKRVVLKDNSKPAVKTNQTKKGSANETSGLKTENSKPGNTGKPESSNVSQQPKSTSKNSATPEQQKLLDEIDDFKKDIKSIEEAMDAEKHDLEALRHGKIFNKTNEYDTQIKSMDQKIERYKSTIRKYQEEIKNRYNQLSKLGYDTGVGSTPKTNAGQTKAEPVKSEPAKSQQRSTSLDGDKKSTTAPRQETENVSSHKDTPETKSEGSDNSFLENYQKQAELSSIETQIEAQKTAIKQYEGMIAQYERLMPTAPDKTELENLIADCRESIKKCNAKISKLNKQRIMNKYDSGQKPIALTYKRRSI